MHKAAALARMCWAWDGRGTWKDAGISVRAGGLLSKLELISFCPSIASACVPWHKTHCFMDALFCTCAGVCVA